MSLSAIVKTGTLALLHLPHVVPDEHMKTIEDINVNRLFAEGYRYALIDWEGTVAQYRGFDLSYSRSKLAYMRREGFEMCILSNCSEQQKKGMEASLNSEGLDIKVHRAFPEKKPFWGAYYGAMALIGASPEKTVFIGDRILTDVLGANLAGLYSIHVTGYPENDSAGIRLAKKMDNALWYAGGLLKR